MLRPGLAALVALLAGAANAAAQPQIRVLSNRADLISGGDALVELRGVAKGSVRAHVGGRDVTSAFALRPNRRLQGLVTGLKDGPNRLVVRTSSGLRAGLTITSHPRGGPVLAGAQTLPWVCNTELHGLGKPLDAACSVPTQMRFVYRSTDPSKPGFTAYDPGSPAADVATTTTDEGRHVPFVVRVETGVMDRGIYSVAVLYDPAKPWTPWAPQPGWNRKLLWPFGGDCKPWHQQDAPVDPLGYSFDPPTGAAFELGGEEAVGSIYGNGNAVAALSRGFAVANSAHTKYGSQCNSVVAAEAIVMLKEHIAETYGPIRYTIGAGSSGGSMQQHQIASGYPGLLDAIQPMASFMDLWGALYEAQDCHLVDHYFDAVSPQLWPVTAQQEAVTGYLGSGACRLQWDGPHKLGTPVVGNYAGMWLDPTNAAGCNLPAEQVYDPQANPKGVRCTVPEYMVSIFGRRPDGFANRPFDNVGVQYGLRALEAGTIVPEQFVDLNEKIGGLDIDWKHQPQRSVADAPAIAAAYGAGLVTHGRELAKVPIVDIRGHDNVEIHSDFHTYSMRARLDRANGHHDNQVVYTGARPLIGDPVAFNRAFDVVDEWLERIEADGSGRPLAEKVRRNRPPAAVDTCWIEGRPVTDVQTCRAAFPYYADPRIAAGGPRADDVLKCRLRPLDRAGYSAVFSDAQWARLPRAFPDGVCDYSVPGVGQNPPRRWTSFAAGPGGRPLGAAPRSERLKRAARTCDRRARPRRACRS